MPDGTLAPVPPWHRPQRGGPEGGTHPDMEAIVKTRKLIAGALVIVAVGACKRPGGASPRTEAVGTSLAASGEGGCQADVDRDLEQVTNCFYLGHPSDPWHFLSRESQSEVGTRDGFNEAFAKPSNWRGKSVTVLGVESRDGQVFGRVEVVYEVARKGGKRCTEVGTKSWTQEAGAWRRVLLRKEEELADQQFQAGDYSESVATAEKWLGLDPFSVEAYKRLVFALRRGGRSSQSSSRSLTETLGAALALNPADSVVLFMTVSWAEDPDVGETLFERFAADDCVREEAAVNLAFRMSPERRLAFLEKLGTTSPRLQMQLVDALLQLEDREKLRTVLTPDLDKEIRAQLEQQDDASAALWSVTMGEAWLLLKNREAAKAWASYAGSRDPSHPGVANLLRRTRE